MFGIFILSLEMIQNFLVFTFVVSEPVKLVQILLSVISVEVGNLLGYGRLYYTGSIGSQR
ncbi:hypothetical protein DSO57_1032342 [Entomophthora muscae]|uniref:Uncharacterized protein n=1 Tax=Entomophthora muscae TaxID=34485 RepID=A0ACC2SQ70_9FUNG|nr:hypothetical protein DSO57_1032342 [Entomophthora muscae]